MSRPEQNSASVEFVSCCFLLRQCGSWICVILALQWDSCCLLAPRLQNIRSSLVPANQFGTYLHRLHGTKWGCATRTGAVWLGYQKLCDVAGISNGLIEHAGMPE